MAKFKPGDTVLNIQTSQKGIVCEICPPARGRQLYRVRYDDQHIEACLEQNLEGVFDIENPFERCRRGIYGNRDQFVLVNTTYKINNSNNNTISSLKASKTLFKAYQFKPLLKFLNSDARRILIADEVGLGKTIEAGHIFLELKARDEFRSVLIICPNSLKIKWQTELKDKFGLNFKIYESLTDAVEDLKAHPQNARGILNYEKVRAKRKDEEKKDVNEVPTNALIDFLCNGQRSYSMILCDEAHKMRNNETQTYRGMSQILDRADAAVFLTATPIMLGEDDLYNLLHLLHPQQYDNKEVFRNLINSNRPFIEAISLLNSNAPLAEIKYLLTNGQIVRNHQIGEAFYTTKSTVDKEFKGIPLYNHIIKQLAEPDTLSLRAKLQEDISSMSAIDKIFSRTRKREVSTEERQQTERKAHKIIVNLSEDERMIFDEVIDDYLESKGGIDYDIYGEEVLPRGTVLGLIQRKRMVASSVNGFRLFTESDCDVPTFCKRIEEGDFLQDAKVDKLLEIFKGIQAAGNNKVILFSIFKFTIRYLEIRLQKLGVKTFVIHGDVREREKVIHEFRNCSAFCILLSTEVGSEGLDMQFCSHLINFDLPWNPMIVEQRIGRIDRFGQKSSIIHIYNLVVSNSIQEVIYDRLLNRIGVFQGVIGDLEMILEENGESFKQLEHDLYGTELTNREREKKIRDLEKAIETEKLHLEEVESGLTNTLTNDVYFQNEINKIKNKRLYVTEEELINYVKMLIVEHLKTCRLEKLEENCYAFSVPKSTTKVVSDFLLSQQPYGDDFEDLFRPYRRELKDDFDTHGRRILTFSQEVAFENKSADYVNIYNPLIIAASVYFKKTISDFGKTFQLKYKRENDLDVSTGLYYLAVYVVTTTRMIMGKSVSSDILLPVVYNVSTDSTITDVDFNLDIFGRVQDKSEFLSLEETSVPLPENALFNMESDFTQYISDYVERKKKETALKDDSLRELRIRQIDEYYKARLKKEEINVAKAEYSIEWLNDEKEIARAQNVLHLAKNRIRRLEDSRAEELRKINSDEPPTITHSLISLTKLVIV